MKLRIIEIEATDAAHVAALLNVAFQKKNFLKAGAQ